MTALTVADRLADFVCGRQDTVLYEYVAHEVKRLLLNQLKASAEACLQPEGRQLLDESALAPRGGKACSLSHVWWSGVATTPQRAAAQNRRLLDLLDFGDTHLPSLGHFTADIVPTLLAQAEVGQHSGERVLQALAVGLEVDIACARFKPARLDIRQDGADAALSIGAVAACCTLLGLDRQATTAALTEACPALATASSAVAEALQSLGEGWHLQEIALHCRPLPVHALAPVDAALALRAQCQGRELRSLRLALSPPAWQLARPVADAAASPELRHCIAAAWQLGQFTADERLPASQADPAIRRLAESVELQIDTASPGLQACVLTAQFADGSSEQLGVDAFLGASGQPLSDSQLSELFRGAADDLVLPRRAGEILHALWGLDFAPDVRRLVQLLRRPA